MSDLPPTIPPDDIAPSGALDPLSVQTVNRQKNSLHGEEKANVAELTGIWLAMESRLFSDMDALALEINTLTSQGRTFTTNRLLSSDRYKTLIISAKQELSGFLGLAEQNIIGNQRRYGSLAFSNARESLTLGLAEFGLSPDIPELPESDLRNRFGKAGNGESIRSLLNPTILLSLASMTRYTLENQRSKLSELIKAMQNGLAFGYNRILNTSRTETNRLYREAIRLQWKESGLVGFYKRLVTHDDRTCAACLADEGHIYPIDEVMPEHPQGRCQAVPIINNLPEPKWRGGEDWFRTQPRSTQTAILGQGRQQLWQSGQFSLKEILTITQNPEWGASLKTTPLRDLLKTN